MSRRSRRGRRLAAILGVAALAGAGCGSTTHHPAASPLTTAPSSTSPSGAGAEPTTAATGAVPAPAAWLSYHGDQARTGAVAGPSLEPATRRWAADLGGVVHGEPVVADGRIFAATENDRVVALSPGTGRMLWSRSIGTPLTDVVGVAGCGDIDPLGVTSTPVVDPSTATLYVVGEVTTGDGTVQHRLVGLAMATGAVTVSDDVDPPLPNGERAVNLLQRAGLALANGRVYVSYGGNDGDCGNYHGWVVGVDATGPPRPVSFEVASDGEGGAIWESGGAPAVDGAGDLYVSTGNANPDPPRGGPDPKRYTESVVKLSPTLQPLASFKDEVAGGDEDLATGNPVLLPDGDVFSVGKTDIGYVLSQTALSRVATITGVCGSNPDGGPAFDAATDTVFSGCDGGGIQEIDLAGDKLGPLLPGADGAPILVGGDLWAVDYPDGTLTAWDAATGKVLQRLAIGQSVPTFATPSAALGLLLVPTDTGITAFG